MPSHWWVYTDLVIFYESVARSLHPLNGMYLTMHPVDGQRLQSTESREDRRHRLRRHWHGLRATYLFSIRSVSTPRCSEAAAEAAALVTTLNSCRSVTGAVFTERSAELRHQGQSDDLGQRKILE